MIAIEPFEDGDHSKPDAKLTAGWWRAPAIRPDPLSCGPYDNVLRILVPLTIEDVRSSGSGHDQPAFC
ncbi:hypothetical protein ACLK19_17715 [Escherichia coli]